jgi:hypothetical protein
LPGNREIDWFKKPLPDVEILRTWELELEVRVRGFSALAMSAVVRLEGL